MPRDDSRDHARTLREMITAVINHANSEVRNVSDPKAQALFETAAEVLIGLRKAFYDFEQKSEPAWKKVG
jgi:hypothetical protein